MTPKQAAVSSLPYLVLGTDPHVSNIGLFWIEPDEQHQDTASGPNREPLVCWAVLTFRYHDPKSGRLPEILRIEMRRDGTLPWSEAFFDEALTEFPKMLVSLLGHVQAVAKQKLVIPNLHLVSNNGGSRS